MSDGNVRHYFFILNNANSMIIFCDSPIWNSDSFCRGDHWSPLAFTRILCRQPTFFPYRKQISKLLFNHNPAGDQWSPLHKQFIELAWKQRIFRLFCRGELCSPARFTVSPTKKCRGKTSAFIFLQNSIINRICVILKVLCKAELYLLYQLNYYHSYPHFWVLMN